MKKLTLLALLLLVNVCYSLQAEPAAHFRHYSTEDGLPQYTLMDMLQDKHGFMWFASWDGISKFDGYRFRNYKSKPGDGYFMKSNRIENIYEDKYGRIWVRSYDGEVHCFDPSIEKFRGVQSSKEIVKFGFRPTDIQFSKSGNVWLLGKKGGSVKVDSLFGAELYNTENSSLKGDIVYSVFEDSDGLTWMLTDNGITQINMNNRAGKSYFYEPGNKSDGKWQPFYSVVEINKQLYFGSQFGRITKYDKRTGRISTIKLPTESAITKIVSANNGKIMIMTESDGLLLYNLKNGKYKLFNNKNTPQMVSNRVIDTFFLNQRYFWFDTQEPGIFRLDVESELLTFYEGKPDDITTSAFPPRAWVFNDDLGRTWVHPKGGGFSLLNPKTNVLVPFYNDIRTPQWRFSNIIHSALCDRQGNLWFCTRSHGLEKVTFDKTIFQQKEISNTSYSFTANEARVIFEDAEQNLWIGTKDCKLSVYRTNVVSKEKVSEIGQLIKSLNFNAAVYSIAEDHQKNIWIGTRGDGLYCLKRGKSLQHSQLEHYANSPSDTYSLSDNSVYSILVDAKGDIWVGTYGGGVNLISQNGSGKINFINYRNQLKNYPTDVAFRVRYLTENKQGNICVGSTGGLVMFSSRFSSPEQIQFRTFQCDPNNQESLSNNDVHMICIPKNGGMYIATFGGGINKVTEVDAKGFPKRFKRYSTINGLPSDITLSLIEDNRGKLWITSENNLTMFDPTSEKFETFAEIKRMMVRKNFCEAAACKLKSHQLIFGFTDGVIYFQPENLIENNYRPDIVFTELQIFNQSIGINDNNSPLTSDINSTKRVVLSHKQNFINIEYAALDYTYPENILYAYKLDGFDPDWVYVQKQRVANYTNLPKGKYTFRVKSTNSEGVWVENERTIEIEILPSFWETYWAYLLYLLLITSIIFIISKTMNTFFHLKANIAIEKKISEMKLRFFTDISHEIRTPLTMITAPVEHIISNTKTPDEIKQQLRMVSHNTHRLLRLVNQILDFRKLQVTHLRVSEINLPLFTQSICETFEDIASEKHIHFRLNTTSTERFIWADSDALEKIIINLISNAFKYTPNGKSIDVSLSSDDKQIILEVKDEGCGISKEKQKNLFERFSSFNVDKSQPSTGIGLSMVKELADKHGAKVVVESLEGEGSIFRVVFQKGNAHFDSTIEIIAGDSHEMRDEAYPEELLANEINYSLPTETLEQKEHRTVLIVEDDQELRQFILNSLSESYEMVEAEDGQDGWEKTLAHLPDIIVSDIMMPRMDGIELLNNIKSNPLTSHIPVVLLTAKTDIESKLKALNIGADDYITKPFSVNYFQARIANIVSQRILLQSYFRNLFTSPISRREESEPRSISQHDDSIIVKVVTYIEEHMENSDFQVEDLCNLMNMGRTVFFKKIKSITGLAPIELVRDIRLKKAAQLLETTDLLIKEVAFSIGINDIRYFTKCFKAKYHTTPVKYREDHRRGEGGME